ncbi:MAG: mechanosensitive ion channel domain-containing protein [Armatimonadota bacterium]
MKNIEILITQEKIQNFIGSLMDELLIFLFFWLAGILAESIFRKIGKKSSPSRARVMDLLGQTCKIGLIIFGIITALGTFGINVSALVAGLGLTGFALGFALKDTLSNILAGMLILLYQPFQIGDYISVTGSEGEVLDIDLRYTTVQGKGKRFLIPNSIIFNNSIALENKKE